MVEDGETEGLSLRVGAEVSLKAEGIDGWDERLDGVEGRAWDGGVLGHMTPGVGQRGICVRYYVKRRDFDSFLPSQSVVKVPMCNPSKFV